MDIYHTKKQTENTPRSCSYLLLKTFSYFISQCTSAPYLESSLNVEPDALKECKLNIFKIIDTCISFYSRNTHF